MPQNAPLLGSLMASKPSVQHPNLSLGRSQIHDHVARLLERAESEKDGLADCL